MNTQNIIFYPAGCYGTFFEWLFTFLENPDIALPFSDSGSSHNFRGNFYDPKEKLFEHVNSNTQLRFSRVHPGLFKKVNENSFNDEYDKVIQRDLDFLKKHFDKILILTYDYQSTLWFVNNQLDKILISEDKFNTAYAPYGYTKEFFKSSLTKDSVERIKHLINQEVESTFSTLTVKNLQGWNKNNIYEFDIWELRELLSFCWFAKSDGQIEAWNTIELSNKDLLFISITDLREKFVEVVLKAAEYFKVDITDTQITDLKEIYQQWAPLQQQIDKDNFCAKIVESLCGQEYFDWADIPLSIIDEAWIQKELLKRDISIKCDKLNVFPTNTKDFKPLLENRINTTNITS